MAALIGNITELSTLDACGLYWALPRYIEARHPEAREIFDRLAAKLQAGEYPRFYVPLVVRAYLFNVARRFGYPKPDLRPMADE